MNAQWNRLLLVGVWACVLSSLGWAKPYETSLSTTALALLLTQDPLADLTAPEVKQKLESLETEVKFVFEKVLTPAGQTAFFQPSPVVFGALLVKFDKSTENLLQALPKTDDTIDLTKQPTGIAALDALNTKYRATSMKLTSWGGAYLAIDPSVNPRRAALEYKTLAGVKYAEPNNIFRLGGGSPVLRMAARPVVYLFTFGWGDCMAGCIYNHRRYFEVFGNKKVEKLAVSGNPLAGDAAKAEAFFQN